MRACCNNNIELIKILVDKGANLDLQDNCGCTALAWACCYNNDKNTEIINILISPKNGVGTNLDLQDICGNTALMYVCDGKNTEIVSYLLEY